MIKAIENWFGRWLLRNPQRAKEGALVLTSTRYGIISPPLEVGSVDEARAWFNMQQWPVGDEARLAQYVGGVWVVTHVFNYHGVSPREHHLEGAMVLTYTWNGTIMTPLEVDSVNEAQSWCRMQPWNQGDDVTLSQYHGGIWVVIHDSAFLTSQLEVY